MSTLAPVIALAAAVAAQSPCLDAACPASPLPALAVEHRGHCAKDVIRWRSEIAVAGDLARNGESYRLALATPLASDTILVGNGRSLVAPLRDDQHRIVGLIVAGEAIAPQRVRRGRAVGALYLQSEQRTPCLPGAATLQPPWIATPAVQKLVLDDAGDLQFEPAAEHGIAHHVPFSMAASLTETMREQADEMLPGNGLPRFEQPIYAVADAAVVAAGGLRGQFVSVAAHRRLVALGAVGGSALLGIGLLALYRLLARQARRDLQRAKVDAELRRIDDELRHLDRTLDVMVDPVKNR
ncbi:MAG: hypothetical protein JXR83_12855 [Deltaproteobacteria bacterium]|nr:hypothetical protein [Deltaproteobacteria bacterium]